MRSYSYHMRRLGYSVVDMLINHLENLNHKPVTSKASRLLLEEKLNEPIPEKGCSIEEILRKIQEDVFSNIMYLNHPVSSPLFLAQATLLV